MKINLNLFSKKVDFLPSLIFIILASHFVYYYNYILGNYTEGWYLIVIGVVVLIFAYVIGKFVKIRVYNRGITDYKKLEKYANVVMTIGILAHLVYYGKNLTEILSGYSDSYLIGRGNGFITVFFDFVILAFGIYEILNSKQKLSKKKKLAVQIGLLVYIVFYMLFLLKRRQIIMLVLIILSVRFNKISISKKLWLYVLMLISFAVFMIFGRVRGYLDVNGFDGLFDYILVNFDASWLSLAGSEGKYISRTHSQVFDYVQSYGFKPEILIGVVTVIIPRKILPFDKPLSFPDWNTITFYPELFEQGYGFAGSFIVENYLIFGITMLVVTYFILGFTLSQVQRRRKMTNDGLFNVFFGWLVYTVALLPRLDFASLYIIFIFWLFPLFYIQSKCSRKIL